jgi:F-type H+-transporting ATPase subunit delta
MLNGRSCLLQDAAVKQIDVPSFSGSFGILPNHVPSLAVLRPGVVTVFENEGAVKKVICSSLNKILLRHLQSQA